MPLVYHHHRDPSPQPPQPQPQPSEVISESQKNSQLTMHSHDLSPTDSPPTSPSATLPPSPDITTSPRISDRAELIERIKAGQTSTWVPNRSLSNYYTNHSPSEQHFIDEHPDRPQSALHQGVFTNESRNYQIHPPSPIFPQIPPFNSGLKSFFSTDSSPPSSTNTSINPYATELYQARNRQRTPSFSSFILKAPTSPLVHSSNPDNDSNESSPSPTSTEPIDISSSKSEKRFSLPPSSLSSLQLSPTISSHFRSQPAGSAAFNRRVSDNWQEFTSPSLSSRQARRLSGLANSTSDLPFGSFVGSYEESILNGRMSTTPSKPLNFVAQIGVLGIGKCKASLRCPTHVTLPFPAYFYSVGDYDSPSPYVGQIDLDTALSTEKSKSSKIPPGVGGAYRIPQRGQLQIVIKNPNKTAVKLFLVPYDLKDMDAGTKTFIRQKSYSAGNALLSDLPQTPTVSMKREKEKDALRYLIHLHIVCPSRGRYYLHKSIRVVFANRVPDGKEKLRNEVLWPEPKFSPWKAESSVSTPVSSTSNRKRSASLFGMMGMKGRSSGSRGDIASPLFSTPNIDSDRKLMDLDSISDVCSDAGEFEKMSVTSSIGRSEGQGLLARKLKSLEVEGGTIEDGPVGGAWPGMQE